jgi:hypothetical protein
MSRVIYIFWLVEDFFKSVIFNLGFLKRGAYLLPLCLKFICLRIFDLYVSKEHVNKFNNWIFRNCD